MRWSLFTKTKNESFAAVSSMPMVRKSSMTSRSSHSSEMGQRDPPRHSLATKFNRVETKRAELGCARKIMSEWTADVTTRVLRTRKPLSASTALFAEREAQRQPVFPAGEGSGVNITALSVLDDLAVLRD